MLCTVAAFAYLPSSFKDLTDVEGSGMLLDLVLFGSTPCRTETRGSSPPAP